MEMNSNATAPAKKATRLLRVSETKFQQTHVTSLFEAARKEDLSTIRGLITQGFVDIDVRNPKGETVLMEAAKRPGSDQFIKTLVEEFGANVLCLDNDGKKVSDYALAAHASVSILEYLDDQITQAIRYKYGK
jgi:hypothetical protein